LKDEDGHVEWWFTVEINCEKYLLGYVRAKSIKRVFEVSQKLEAPDRQISLRPNGGNYRSKHLCRPAHRHAEGLVVRKNSFSKAVVRVVSPSRHTQTFGYMSDGE
jgi:hypothetical protein